MKILLISVAIVTAVVAKSTFPKQPESNLIFGYLKNVGIPRANAIRDAEEAHQKGNSRIHGGQQASPGQIPYQAGLIITFPGGTGVCGGSLVSGTRVVTAAHCWFDGFNQASIMTVVLGSIYVFSGGTRLDTATVVMHPNWSVFNIANDIAVVYLPRVVSSSNTIAPIALPSGSQLNENFAGSVGIVSGYGLIAQGFISFLAYGLLYRKMMASDKMIQVILCGPVTHGYTQLRSIACTWPALDVGLFGRIDAGIAANQFLNFINVNVITNEECTRTFGNFVQPTTVCSRGIGNTGACSSDSGGPLAVTRNNRPLLIGVLSFGPVTCGGQMTNGFVGVASYINFINQNL